MMKGKFQQTSLQNIQSILTGFSPECVKEALTEVFPRKSRTFLSTNLSLTFLRCSVFIILNLKN